jgi:hypothetical protein
MSDTPQKPEKSPLEIRKKVLADPNTAKLAEKLGVPLEEYVEGVVHFAMNPGELPEYVVVSDETLKEQFGLGPSAKAAEITKLFETSLEMATLTDTTDYSAPKAKPVQLASDGGSQAPVGKQDEALKDDLKKQLLGKKGKV